MLITVFLFACRIGVSSRLQFRLSRERTSWQQASDSCNQRDSGALALLNSEELWEQFDKDVVPSGSERLWVGRYIAYTPFVWIYGCYRNGTIPFTSVKRLKDNYLVTCLHECRRSPYIGMQADLCFCFDTVPANLKREPGINCVSECPGEELENKQRRRDNGNWLSNCGQKAIFNTVSVYKRAKQDEVNLVRPIPDVGECIFYNPRTKQWSSQDCEKQEVFTCDKINCDKNQQEAPNSCVLASTVPQNWYFARSKCEGNGMFLSFMNLTATSFFGTNDPNLNVWTGLHRKEVVLWSHDSERHSIVSSDRCVVVFKEQATGRWDYEVVLCNNAYRYVCIENFRTTTLAPSTRITTPSTSRRTIPTRRPTTTGDQLPTVNPYAQPINITDSSASTICNGYLNLWLRFVSIAIPMILWTVVI